MKNSSFFLPLLVSSLFVVSSCRQDLVESDSTVYQSNFGQSDNGWVADYADYSTVTDDIQFESRWTGLPQPLDGNRKSILMSSINRSDDVFMFLTKKLTGMQPNRDYQLIFTVELASAYPAQSLGIGGSPGSSVYLKVGATAIEPKKRLTGDFYEMNIDKGIQSEGGRDAVVLGNIGIEGDATAYKLITRSNTDAPFTVSANAQGELWLLVGTDSGYEGETTLYYSSIRVSLK